MENKKEVFQYTYSAKRQEEIQNIRKKYLPEEEDKMERLRRLDRGTTKKGTIISIMVGVVGCLLLGVGMCCTMIWAQQWFIPGILIGIVGIVGIAAAYPLYARITKKERKKLAPQILKLTDELSKPE
ncbi:MAG TPA: hypothetical protein IAB39_02890 [Candidatus Onthovicinus excrementipullorum]|nr:hypothetical protein [Candidatus Onthovicinus excrementipullorum]